VAFCPAVHFPGGILSGGILSVTFFPVAFCPVALCPGFTERRTTSATFLGSISAKLPTNTCPGGSSRHMVSYSRKVSIKGSNLPNYSTPFVLSLRVTGNVLQRLHSFHLLVDIPQIYLSWVTFAEGCTVFHLSTSEIVLISNGDTWMGTQSRHLARGGTLLNRRITNITKHHSPGGATIGYVRLGSPICSGIIIHCTFSSIVL